MICHDRHHHRLVEDAALTVDVGAFTRAGIFDLGNVTGTVGTDDGAVAFAVQHRGEEGPLVSLACVIEAEGERRQVRADVPIAMTKQRVGTRRWWSCPRCGRRTKLLYLAPGMEEMCCRICGGLVHASAALHTNRVGLTRVPHSCGT